MRAVLALLVLASLTACSESTSLTRPHTPVTALPARPAEVTCPEGKPLAVQLDYRGDRSFTELLTVWSTELGRPLVDRSARQVWFLRDDGSAHTRLAWTRARRPVAGRAWFVDGLEQCSDHARWRPVAAPSAPATLEVGHCWVEPVVAEGRTWDVTREDQFGWGGPAPQRLVLEPAPGTGRATTSGELSVAGDVAVYVDRSGVRLTLVPDGDPWALERGGCD